MEGFAIMLEELNRKVDIVLLLAERAAGVTEGVAFQYPGEYNKGESGYQGSAQGRVSLLYRGQGAAES